MRKIEKQPINISKWTNKVIIKLGLEDINFRKRPSILSDYRDLYQDAIKECIEFMDMLSDLKTNGNLIYQDIRFWIRFGFDVV